MPAEVLLDGETVMSDRYAEVTGVPHDAPSQAVLHTQCTALIGIASLLWTHLAASVPCDKQISLRHSDGNL